ncbi:serine protease [Streptomyces luteireticuli]|uniref:trypsin-like serine peptidase n=1 Tax=Streptomyces luteireticuli TaxID=173858 RepID=UPI0035569F1E
MRTQTGFACKTAVPVLGAVLLLGAVPSALANPIDESAPDTVVQPAAVSATQQQEVEAYWTLERMIAVGAPGPEDPREPTDAEWNKAGLVSKAVGRLFFTTPSDHMDRSCTATITKGRTGTTVVTAAHCLGGDLQRTGNPTDPTFNPGQWNQNLYFVPGYKGDEQSKDKYMPYGGFTVRQMITDKAWTTSRNPIGEGHDAAMVTLNTGKDKRTAAESAGAMPIAFTEEPSASQKIYNFGYPYEGEIGNKNQGARLVSCSGSATGAPEGVHSSLRETCPLGRGASGGPHLTGFDEGTGLGTIVGVNSLGTGGRMYGTRLGKTAEALYRQAESL